MNMPQPISPARDVMDRVSRLLQKHRTWVIEDDVIRGVVNVSIRRVAVFAALGKLIADGLIEVDVELIGEDEMGPTRSIYRWRE